MTRDDVEIFSLCHVFYPGHWQVNRVHSPPATDGLWAYEPLDQSGRNTDHRGGNHPSSVFVPLADARNRGSELPPEAACGTPLGHQCV